MTDRKTDRPGAAPGRSPHLAAPLGGDAERGAAGGDNMTSARDSDDLIIEREYEPDEEAIARAVAILLPEGDDVARETWPGMTPARPLRLERS